MGSLKRMFKSRWFLVMLVFAVCLFGLGLVVGLGRSGGTTLAGSVGGLEQLADFLKPYSIWTALLIFLKNALTLFLVFIFSPILLLVPLSALYVNGWVLGVVGNSVAAEKSAGYVLAGILPHGVIELPVFFVGCAIALCFGAVVIGSAFSDKVRQSLKVWWKGGLKALVALSGFLFVAAFVETYLTPLCIKGG